MKTALWLAALALPVAAQPPKLVNAQVDKRPVQGSLPDAMRALESAQPQPAWIGYTVPAARTRNFGCDSHWSDGQTVFSGGTVHLEPAAEILLLFRVDGNHMERVRTMAPDCDIDAGGVPLHWLTGVEPAASVALLAGMAAAQERMSDSALSAIAYHAVAAADTALESLTRAGQPEWLRQRAVYWLGSARGRAGVAAIRRVLAEDSSTTVRERALRGLAANREAEALDLLLSVARDDRSSKLRAQALASLGRRRGPEAVAAITQAIDRDTAADVRRAGVSALRNLPESAGVPLLIQLARTHRDAEVRKQAMRALSGSHDPQALAFFEEVLQVR